MEGGRSSLSPTATPPQTGIHRSKSRESFRTDTASVVAASDVTDYIQSTPHYTIRGGLILVWVKSDVYHTPMTSWVSNGTLNIYS